MNTFEEFMQQAEECERLATVCVSASNRDLLLLAACQWRRMADEVAVQEPRALLPA